MTAVLKQARYTALLNVAGVILPVRSFECRYQLNDIPAAEVRVPMGALISVPGFKVPSPVYQMPILIDENIPAELWVNDRLIMAGYVRSVGFSQNVAGDGPEASAVLGIQHWLGTLSFATLMGPRTHASSPTRFIIGMEVVLGATPAAAGIDAAFMRLAPNLEEDIWNNLKPWLRWVITQSDSEQKRSRSKKTYDILDAMISPVPLPLRGYKPPPGQAPDKAQGEQQQLQKLPPASIRTTMVDGFLGNYRNEHAEGATLWDRLINFLCPYFLLAISPTPTAAYVIPNAPTAYPEHTITADQHSVIQFASTFSPPISAVGVYVGHFNNLYADGAGTAPQPAGMFPTGRPGRVLFLPGPPILAGTQIQDIARLGVLGNIWTSATKKKSRKWSTVVNRVLKKITEDVLTNTELGDRFAASYFDQMMFAQRQAVIGGPLDFVYAPGTPLYVQPTYGSPPWLGRVEGVHIKLDADACYATVSHFVRYCRSPSEHAVYGFDTSPVYGTAWSGGLLF